MKTMVMLVMAVLALVAIAGYSDGKSSPTKKAATNSEDDAAASKEPSALTVARKAYQTQANSAIDPIKKKYLAQLEDLKKQLGGKGDLEGATAVQREIDAVNRAAKKENIGTADGDEATDNSYEPTGMWKFTCTTSGWSSTLDIKDDGTCHVGDGRNGTWEVKGGKLTVTLPDGVNEFKINKNATDLLNGKNKYKPELKVKLEKIQTDVKGEPAANGGDATAEDDSEDDSADDPAAKNTGVPTGSWHVTWKSGSTHLYIFNKDGTVTMGSDYDAKGHNRGRQREGPQGSDGQVQQRQEREVDSGQEREVDCRTLHVGRDSERLEACQYRHCGSLRGEEIADMAGQLRLFLGNRNCNDKSHLPTLC